ncbi:MAG: LacI family DNA-binding transcriptional regulator [Planctomycetota bacterium]
MKPKNASLKDVAEQAGVSKSTASRILTEQKFAAGSLRSPINSIIVPTSSPKA